MEELIKSIEVEEISDDEIQTPAEENENELFEDCVDGDELLLNNKLATATYTQFKIRKSKPKSSDKNVKCYITGSKGWSGAITGKPKDKTCNVLSNCVGYAQGRFCEIYNEITGHTGTNKYYKLNCNAENFITRAKKSYPKLKIGQEPKPGAIMVWGGKGDLCGHVAIVERVNSKNSVLTSESSYGGTAFTTKTRKNTNGRWGAGSNYPFKGFIYNPAVKEEEEEVLEVNEDIYKNQLKTSGTILRIRKTPGLSGEIIGHVKDGAYYNYYEKTKLDGYTWYRIGSSHWCAKTSSVKVIPGKIKKFLIELPVNIPQISIDVESLSVEEGSTVTLSVKVKHGYELSKLLLDGEELSDNKFIMPGHDVKITAEVNQLKYSIEVRNAEHGEVLCEEIFAVAGSEIIVSTLPEQHYKLKELLYNGKKIIDNKFIMPDSNVIIESIFEPLVSPKFKVGDKVKLNDRGNSSPNGSGTLVFMVGSTEYISNIIWKDQYSLEEFCYEISALNGTKIGYYKEADLELVKIYPKTEFNIGDKIQIIGKGNSSPDGTGFTTFGITWKQEILSYKEGSEYPYLVGKNDKRQGWYKPFNLKKL